MDVDMSHVYMYYPNENEQTIASNSAPGVIEDLTQHQIGLEQPETKEEVVLKVQGLNLSGDLLS